jgi:hypothetical protein
LTVAINLQDHGWLDWYRITEKGARTPAIVTGRNRAVHDSCRFEFHVESRTYSGSQPGCGLEVGMTAEVVYLPDDPSFATLRPPGSELLVRLIGPLALAGFAGIVSAWRTPRGAPPF